MVSLGVIWSALAAATTAGAALGTVDGLRLGGEDTTLGLIDGIDDGFKDGHVDGENDGFLVGLRVLEGIILGDFVGVKVDATGAFV